MNFRKYNPNDQVKVIDLLNLSLGRNHPNLISAQTFEWKHFDKIFDGGTIAFVAEIDNQIVSFVCFTPLKLNTKELIWNCSIQATDPEFRRQGIVTKLTKLCEEQIQIISDNKQNSYIGFCNESGLQIDLNSKKIQHQIVGQFNQLIIFPSFFNFKNKSELIKNKKILTWNKDESYLKWKYENNPKTNYEKISNESWTIYYKKSFFKVEICDIIFKTNQKLDLSSAIDFIKNKFPTKIITLTYLPNSSTHFISNQRPLFSLNRTIPTWLTVQSENSELLNSDNWLLFGGDII